MSRITLLGRSKRSKRRRGLRGAACGAGWKLNKKRTKCIRRRGKR